MKAALLNVALRLVVVLCVVFFTYGFVGSLFSRADECNTDSVKSSPAVRLLTAIQKAGEVQP